MQFLSRHSDTDIASCNSPLVAEMSYLSHRQTERPWSYTFNPPPDVPWESGEFVSWPTRIHNARKMDRPASLQDEGFELRFAPTAVVDFDDEASVHSTYYAEAKKLVLHATGAKEAHVFDHLVRRRATRGGPLNFGRGTTDRRAAANGRIHNDYTEASGLSRLRKVLDADGAVTRIRRFGIINVWRALNGPVQDAPLAVCDARTIGREDLVESDVLYPRRTGEIYLLKHSPRHRWSYFPEMGRDEVLLFKQYDSQISGVARFTPHAAFDLPHPPPGTPPRESIELRCLVVYDLET